MRRNRLRVLLCLFSLILFTSCAGEFGAIIPEYSVYDSVRPEGLEIFLKHDFSAEDLLGFRSLVQKFNDTNEWNIHVNLSTGSDVDVDFKIVSPSEAIFLLRRDESIELSPLIYHPVWGIPEGRGNFYKAARKQTDYWDFSCKVTAIPLSMDANVLLLNNDVLHGVGFSDFPESWPGMNYLLWKIKREGQFSGMGIDCNAGSLISIINARGGSILRPNGFSYNFNNPVVNRTIRYVRRNAEGDVISDNSSEYLNQTEFTFGKLLSVFTGADGIKYYNSIITAARPELDWSVSLLPTRRLGSGLTVNCSRNAVITSGDERRQLASWLFIRWAASTDIQVELSEFTGSFPSNIKATQQLLESRTAGSIFFQPEQWFQALELFNNSHMDIIPNSSDYAKVLLKFNNLLDGCLSGQPIWLETWRLDREVREQRRNEREEKGGKE